MCCHTVITPTSTTDARAHGLTFPHYSHLLSPLLRRSEVTVKLQDCSLQTKQQVVKMAVTELFKALILYCSHSGNEVSDCNIAIILDRERYL